MLDDSDKAAIAAATRQAIDDATAQLVARITALEARPTSDVTAADLSAISDGLASLRRDTGNSVTAFGEALGEPEEIAARNARVDFVLDKYYGGENDRPPAVKANG